jgi:TRL-like protein family
MHRTVKMVALCAGVVFLSSCGVFLHAPVKGLIFTSVEGPITATASQANTRRGEACAWSLLGLLALGDASIEEAKSNGKISEVSTVDHESFHILGIFATFCTVVRGS